MTADSIAHVSIPLWPSEFFSLACPTSSQCHVSDPWEEKGGRKEGEEGGREEVERGRKKMEGGREKVESEEDRREKVKGEEGEREKVEGEGLAKEQSNSPIHFPRG